jgi:hypothetical protein
MLIAKHTYLYEVYTLLCDVEWYLDEYGSDISLLNIRKKISNIITGKKEQGSCTRHNDILYLGKKRLL